MEIPVWALNEKRLSRNREIKKTWWCFVIHKKTFYVFFFFFICKFRNWSFIYCSSVSYLCDEFWCNWRSWVFQPVNASDEGLVVDLAALCKPIPDRGLNQKQVALVQPKPNACSLIKNRPRIIFGQNIRGELHNHEKSFSTMSEKQRDLRVSGSYLWSRAESSESGRGRRQDLQRVLISDMDKRPLLRMQRGKKNVNWCRRPGVFKFKN